MSNKRSSLFTKAAALATSAVLGGYVAVRVGQPQKDEFLWCNVVKPFLFRFLDAETAHRLAVQAASLHLVPYYSQKDGDALHVKLWNRNFNNPVGLAAGFDKNAEAVDGMLGMGFGFVEIGSVCPKPQPGNPQPRVFRLIEDEAVINRYGFNSDGAALVQQRLESRFKRIASSPPSGLLGVNLGKNKETVEASDDYVLGVQQLGKYADYLVVNVSSPNTQGLRDLQHRHQLATLLSRVKTARDELAHTTSNSSTNNNSNSDNNSTRLPPLLVKIAPDLSMDEKRDIAHVALEVGVDGIIVSNTTVQRFPSLQSAHAKEIGGLSGAPLFDLSTQTLRDMYELTDGKVPLVGVGGISNAEQAYAKIKAGASLLQVYSALVYKGPALVPNMKRDLERLLRQDGFTNIQQAVGVDVRLRSRSSISSTAKNAK